MLRYVGLAALTYVLIGLQLLPITPQLRKVGRVPVTSYWPGVCIWALVLCIQFHIEKWYFSDAPLCASRTRQIVGWGRRGATGKPMGAPTVMLGRLTFFNDWRIPILSVEMCSCDLELYHPQPSLLRSQPCMHCRVPEVLTLDPARHCRMPGWSDMPISRSNWLIVRLSNFEFWIEFWVLKSSA